MHVGGLLTRGEDDYVCGWSVDKGEKMIVCGWSVDKGEKMIMSVGGLLTRGRR